MAVRTRGVAWAGSSVVGGIDSAAVAGSWFGCGINRADDIARRGDNSSGVDIARTRRGESIM